MIERAFWQNRRVALTGYSGFKGAWLARWLDELGAHVHGYALEQPAPNALEALEPTVVSTIGDIRDRERVAAWLHSTAPEILFHLAAQPLVRAGYDDPVGTFDTNVTGTLNVLEAVRTLDSLRSVVVVTSDKAYAPANGQSLPESAHLGGWDPYSASKACADILTTAYSHAFTGRAIIATARAGNVIGGGDWSADRLIPDLVRSIRDGRRLVLRYPSAVRPWQHVLEPLAGYLLLAQRAAAGDLSVSGAWNFGPAQHDAITVADVVERALRAAGRAPAWSYEATSLAELPALRIDSSKARALLGWRPVFEIDQAIAETMTWYDRALTGGDTVALSGEQILRYMQHAESAATASS